MLTANPLTAAIMGFLNCVRRVQSPRKFDEQTSWNVKFSISLMSAPAKKRKGYKMKLLNMEIKMQAANPLTAAMIGFLDCVMVQSPRQCHMQHFGLSNSASP